MSQGRVKKDTLATELAAARLQDQAPPNGNGIVEYLVVRDRNRVVDNVANQAQLGTPQCLLALEFDLQNLLLLLAVDASLDQFGRVLLFL